MKKITALILSAVMLALSFSIIIYAAPILGDLNGDGKVTASDARAALRMSARLVETTEDALAAADLDGNGRISASEARTILRVSARLEEFETTVGETTTEEPSAEEPSAEEPTTQEPTTQEPTTQEPTTVFDEDEAYAMLNEDVRAFCRNQFYIEGRFAGSNETTIMASNGKKIELSVIMEGMSMGFFIDNRSVYLKNYTKNSYVTYEDILSYITQEGYEDPLESMNVDELTLGVIEMDRMPEITAETTDGVETQICTVFSGDTQIVFTIVDGEVKTIQASTDGETTLTIDVDVLSAQIPDNMLTVKGYTKKTAIAFMLEMAS